MYEQLLQTIGSLGTPRILIAGDFMLDVYVYGDAARISPEAPVPILRVTQTESRCGGAGSVAADLAALGATPVCLGIVGEDANGAALQERLTALGADTSGICPVADRPTTTKQRLIGLAQHRHKQQLMRIDQESTEPLPPSVYDRLLRAYSEALEHVDLVCLQDYDKGMLVDAVCQEMIRRARAAGRKVLVDPVLRRDYAKYAGATLLTPNRYEASTAVGYEVRDLEAAARAAGRLREMLQLEAVVLTLDREGLYLCTDRLGQPIPAKPRSVYDVTGAGDEVLAMLAVALAAESDYLTAAHLANLAGGIEVEKFGAATVTVAEMTREIAGRFGTQNTKLRTLDELREELDRRRSCGQTIVFTNGCFDVIHRGHVEYLRFCKTQGDVVVVGLNSDNSVRALKGPQRPIYNQQDRATVLAGLETVDLITIFDDASVLGLVQKVRPDVIVKGGDWGNKQGVVGWDFVESYGGRVVLAPLVQGRSSTATIEKMKELQTNTNGG